MTLTHRFSAAIALAALLAVTWSARPAAAHPLGNFTVNRYSRLELSPNQLRVRYVMDLAEIPAFQAITRPPDGSPALDTNGDGTVSAAERRSYAERQMAAIARGLELTAGGARVPLRPENADAELLPGQGGLQTLRLSAWLVPANGRPLDPLGRSEALRVTLRDMNDPGKVGWREMVVVAEGIEVAAVGGVALLTRDVSDELRRYPEDLLQLPLDVREIAFTAAPAPPAESETASGGSSSPAAAPALAGRRSLERARDGLADLVAATALTPAVVLAALLAAMMFGAMHALSPGHGKTIVGAYLVGSRGTAGHALFLGVTVTLVHTATVFALLLITLFASEYVLPEQVFPWMSLASGLLVLAIGASLFWMRRHGAAAHQHAYDHDHTDLSLDTGHSSLTHSHGLGTHTHAVPGADGAPVTWRSLLALGVSGGLLPCPSAMVLGLGAIALGRALYGLALILAFSAGLAATLVAIGLAVVFSGRLASGFSLMERIGLGHRRAAALVRVVPLASAGVVSLAGIALAVEAAAQLDLPALWRTSETFRSLAAVALAAGTAALAIGAARARSVPASASVAPARTSDHDVRDVHYSHGSHGVHAHAHIGAWAHAHAQAHAHSFSRGGRRWNLRRQA